ncbi:hypothetical protein Pint_16379 [Pistacia integerrima]|uniref:Uncharacterized protein n=1 Tax=Pistacia integerrima TaxID=434235 RepID=A0ACC0ZEB9_9ROSI|nr:hypothetical protein Pint_16379 [Pistacia integerrima]
MNREDMEEELSKHLEGKRYLIVLDDIWNKEVWDDLKAAFPDEKNGSRIIFTTRFKDVALHADPRSPPYEPCLLNEENSWELLSRKAFPGLNAMASLPPWSKELGNQILKKCGGLPLAIVVLGGLLSRKEATYSEWLKFVQSLQWQLTKDPAKCADILKLSYQELPFYLKSCFLYIGLFPEDFEISARRLIMLWVAEGFVQPRGEEQLEDVAEDYLEELIGRSMIQAATRKSNGRIKTIRTLQGLSVGETSCIEQGLNKLSNLRELGLFGQLLMHEEALGFKKKLIDVEDFPPNLTELCLQSSFLMEDPMKKLEKLQNLRVLRLKESSYVGKEMVCSSGGFPQLHFLKLSRLNSVQRWRIEEGAMCNLRQLEIVECKLLKIVPRGLWPVTSLHNLKLGFLPLGI